jgi:hypothetical protein
MIDTGRKGEQRMKGDHRMKITKDNFMKATAEAMNRDATLKLFNAEPQAFDMFSLFSFTLFTRLEGKDVTEDDFTDSVAMVLVDVLPDSIKQSTMIKNLALIMFSLQIWDELEKLDKSDSKNPKYSTFKSELKSKID